MFSMEVNYHLHSDRRGSRHQGFLCCKMRAKCRINIRSGRWVLLEAAMEIALLETLIRLVGAQIYLLLIIKYRSCMMGMTAMTDLTLNLFYHPCYAVLSMAV